MLLQSLNRLCMIEKMTFNNKSIKMFLTFAGQSFNT